MDNNFREILFSYLLKYHHKYPVAGIRDIYKLLYQVFHGAHHAIVNEVESREYLYREWDGLENENTGIEICEPVNIRDYTPPLFRLNLMPAKANGLSRDIIFRAFLSTARNFPESTPALGNLHDAFISAWETVGSGIDESILPFERGEYENFTGLIREKNWPPAHHSEEYMREYSPHYRLVMDCTGLFARED